MRWRYGFLFVGSWADVVRGRCAGATVPTWCRVYLCSLPTWCRRGAGSMWCRRCINGAVSMWYRWCGVDVVSTGCGVCLDMVRCRCGVDAVSTWCRRGAKWYTLFLWGRFFGVLSGAQNVPKNGRNPTGAKCGRFAMIYFYSAQKFARVISAGGPAVPGCFFLASTRGCGGSFFVLFSIKKRASFQLARFVVCIIFLGRRLYLA